VLLLHAESNAPKTRSEAVMEAKRMIDLSFDA